jgi:large subunit ribosomal protein L6
MSRIGRTPIAVPAGVEVDLEPGRVAVRGPKGSLARSLPEPVTVRRDEATSMLVVERPNDERRSRALHGLTRTLVANMVTGSPKASRRSWRSSGFRRASRFGVSTRRR